MSCFLVFSLLSVVILFNECTRHSNRFYSILCQQLPLPSSSSSSSSSLTSVVELLAGCCMDNDASIRKFACFASE